MPTAAAALLTLCLSPWVERQIVVMGTSLHARVDGRSRTGAIAAIEAAFAAVERVDSLLSTWRPDAELARLNREPAGRARPVSPELAGLLAEAAAWRDSTTGAFDPAVGALIDAYDLRGSGRRPAAPELTSATAAVRGGFRLHGDSAVDIAAGTWLDSGGFGKGAALRSAGEALVANGVTAALLNFGGQVLAIGAGPEGAPWEIPVAHPERRDEAAAVLRLRDRSASTSSQSERFVDVGGARVGHIVDPRTGLPVPPWGSATVVAADPLVADALSTALLVLGPDAAAKWAERRADVGVLLLVERDGTVERRWNAAMAQYLVVESHD